jgi:iron(III) transport system ATP-binding protein
MRVVIQNLTKRFGSADVLKNLSFAIEPQELFFLLGPSGCGKTTLLRTIAGFYQPDSGQLFFGDTPLAGVPPHKRNTGMVFQNYALWPHMTVAENVAYGLDIRSVEAAEKQRRVMEALEVVQMAPYAERSPNQLSGGQQQRVALARALVIKPLVLLLDEPLSNLDAKLRLEMREEIRRIHAQTRITTIYVTHDQKEALSLADRMAVLRDGLIEQIGDPRTIYRSPANRFVADFIGESNWIEATVAGATAEFLLLDSAHGSFHAQHTAGFSAGQNVLLGFRPEAVQIGTNPLNALKPQILQVSYLGEVEQYELALPGPPPLRIKAIEANPIAIRPRGSFLDIHIRPQDVMVLHGT